MKANRILICINDDLLAIRIKNIIQTQGKTADVTNHPIKTDDTNKYDALVIHSSYRITGTYGFIENIVMRKSVPVVFLSSNPQGGILRNLRECPNFIHISETKMEAELPVALVMYQKLMAKNQQLEKENRNLKNKGNNHRLFSECKRQLIEAGLSEDEAHKKILRYAMDNKIDKYSAARKLLQKNTNDIE
mgnify:CR=1 FL=1